MMRFPTHHHSDATSQHDPQDGNDLATTREIPNRLSLDGRPTVPSVVQKLNAAQEAAQSGERRQAYELSREATLAVPENVDAWLLRGQLADSSEECLACISKAIALAPEHSAAKHNLYDTLKRYLDEDPFLRYIEETDVVYRVLTGEGRAVVIPKDRAVAESYPPVESSPLRPVFLWLVLSAIGLLTAGLGTVVCAPIAIALAWRASQMPLNHHQRRRVQFALLYAHVLFAIGLLLTFVFLLHL